MKFSVFSVSIPDWEPGEAISTLQAQGWDGIEWRVVDQEPAEEASFWRGNRATVPFTGVAESLAAAVRLANEGGIAVSGIGSYVPCDDRESVETILDAVANAGANRVRINVPQLGGAPYPDLFDTARRDYEWVAQRAAVHGVTALVEIHHRTIVSSASAARRFVDGLV